MQNFERLCPGCMKDNAGQSVCGICGYDSAKNNPPDKLPTRFIIRDRYFVGKMLYSNTESTVYLGFDSIQNKTVNIKEYFPTGLARRNPDKTVFVSREAQYAYNEGLIEFMDINKKLIGFPLASMPATYSVFEENSTGYAICEPISGITLNSFIARNGGTLKWEQMRPLILPLIDTVKSLNEIGITHGDISPETVIVCRDGKLRLLGVSVKGIRIVPEDTDLPSAQPTLHDGYAAAEQYGLMSSGIGECSDVYGICATLLTALTGIIPPKAEERIKSDSLKIPAHFADELPRQVLVSLANGLQIKPADRTANIETLKNELIYGETRENMRKAQRAAEIKQKSEAERPAKEKKGSGVKYALIASAITVGLFLLAGLVVAVIVYGGGIWNSIVGFFGKGVDDASSDMTPGVISSDEQVSSEVESKFLYTVPELRGKYFVELEDIKELSHFNVVIKSKEYSSSYERGKICAQSIAAGESKEHDTVIEVTVSLGTREMRMPGIVGLDEDKAMIELLKLGLLERNIEIVQEYDASIKPGTVLRQYPERNKAITAESAVRVYVAYNEEEDNSGDGEEYN